MSLSLQLLQAPRIVVLRLDDVVGDMSSAEREVLHAQLVRIAGTPTGSRLLRFAIDHRVTIRFGEEDELRLPNRSLALGLYMSAGRTIVLSRPQPEKGRLEATIAHELQHFADDVMGFQLGTIQSEARASLAEAKLCAELGIESRSIATGVHGELRTFEQVESALRAHPFYGGLPEEGVATYAGHLRVGARPLRTRIAATASGDIDWLSQLKATPHRTTTKFDRRPVDVQSAPDLVDAIRMSLV
jgi:hypothetical protein